jgi:ABC-type Zn uptake system ZnuABC Zn-binding protein ZnuA
MDPVLVKEQIAPLLSKELKSIYPQGSIFFEENLQSFQHRLEALHNEINEMTASFPQKRFISFHSAWNYFARRYGLEEVASVEKFPGKEPSAKWLAELVKLADLHDIRVIFAEPQLGNKVAEIIAGEIGGKVLLLDPLGGKGLPERESYLELIRYNANIFRQALQ